jgi:hypothetical protein
MGFAMRCSNRSRPSGGFLCRPNFGISAPVIEGEPNGGRGSATCACFQGLKSNGARVRAELRAGTRRFVGRLTRQGGGELAAVADRRSRQSLK